MFPELGAYGGSRLELVTVSRTMAEEDATWRRLIRSPRSSATIELSRRCSVTVFLPVASTSRRTRSATSPSASLTGTCTSSANGARAPCEGEPRRRLERAPDLQDHPRRAARCPRRNVSRIELIPPVHQRVYRMGLEHLGVVVGDEFDEFSRSSGRTDRAAVPERGRRSGLRAVRGLHPREVLPALLSSTSSRMRSGATRASSTSTTGYPSGWSPQRARTRSPR